MKDGSLPSETCILFLSIAFPSLFMSKLAIDNTQPGLIKTPLKWGTVPEMKK